MRIRLGIAIFFGVTGLGVCGCGESKPPTGAMATQEEDPQAQQARIKAMQDAEKAAPPAPAPK